MHNKTLTINEIERMIDDLNTVRDTITEALQIPCDDISSTIAGKYIELQNVVETADYLNSQGFRVYTGGCRKGDRKYISNDVADTITDINNKGELFTVARALFNYNKGKISTGALIRQLRNIKPG